MVIDYNHPESDPVTVTGSFNWTLAGNDSNDENMIVFKGQDIARYFFHEIKARILEAGGDLPVRDMYIPNFRVRNVDGGFFISWDTPSGNFLNSVIVCYNTDSFPSSTNDGIVIGRFKPEKTDYILKGNFIENKTYYFSAFLKDTAGSLNRFCDSATFNSSLNLFVSDNFINEDSSEITILLEKIPEKVSIYDIYGRPVKIFKDLKEEFLVWNLKDDNNISVKSGVYIISVRYKDNIKNEAVIIKR